MSKKPFLQLTFCLVLLLAISIGATAANAPGEDLVKADWSVNAAHNLASNPPSLDAVQDFYDRANGDDAPLVHVCEFRFANLRNSRNLSLILTVEPGNWGCTQLDIFDRTPTGFELYSPTWLDFAPRDLANRVLDLDHDGRHELAVWAPLAPYATGAVFGRLGCDADWPLIFAWTGNTYADVSDQYKDYYRSYLKSVNARLAAYSSVLAPAVAPTANTAPDTGSVKIPGHFVELSPEGGGEGRGYVGPAPVTPAPTPGGAAIPAWAARNEARRNYLCTGIEAAKTEAFLGIHSDSTMSAAIKDSESGDPNKRIAAAVVFSYLATQEADQDLKTLSSDADPRVAAAAKSAASFGEDPPPNARRVRREDTYLKLNESRQSKP